MAHRQFASGGGEGARIRAMKLLRGLNLDTGKLERIAGASNEVWYAGDYVLRIAPLSMTNRLASEAALLPLLPAASLRPTLVASGREEFGEWIVVNRRPGRPLSDVWMTLDEHGRRRVIEQLADALRVLHATQVGPGSGWPLPVPMSAHALAQFPLYLTPRKLGPLLQHAATMPYVDKRLLGQVVDLLEVKAPAFVRQPPPGVVHGDFHFENVLVEGTKVTSLIDFEWSCLGPPDFDLDVMLRFCDSPELHVGSQGAAENTNLQMIPRWLQEFYPELFDVPMLEDRLMIYSLTYDLRDMVRQPPTVPMDQDSKFSPLNRIHSTLSGRSYLRLLGGY